LSDGAAALAGAGVGALVGWAGAVTLGVGAGFADESARAAERVDKDTKAATPSAMAEVRVTL
jgi:hypothetical protein